MPSWRRNFTKFTDGSGSYAFALSPARALTATTACYMVDTNPNGATSVNLWKVTGAPSAPVLTRVATVSCGTYAVPPDASQSGTSTKIATGDCRTQDCTWRSGTMWTGWSEANASAAGVRYFTINTSTGVKIKDITYSSTANYYYPAVTSDGAGNGYVVASRSSSTTFASMYRTGIKTTETTLETMASVKAGVASNTSGRWGDYSAIHNDPSNSNHVWLYAGWANSGNAWATWITDSYFTLAAPGTTGSPSPVLAAVRVSAIEENASHPSIHFSLAKAAPATVSLYSATGRLVRRMDLPSAIQGDNTAVWDGLDVHGIAAPAGVYLVRVESGATRATSRIVRM